MNEYTGYEVAQGWLAENFSKFSSGEEDYFKAELLSLMPPASTGATVLDIGFGNGGFLGWAKSLGYAVTGLEVNEKLVSRAQSAGFTAAANFSEILASENCSFDVITAFDVLEHIRREDLVDFLRSVRAICSTDAVVVLRFPNGDNPFSLFMQNGDVTHQAWIGRGMLHQVAHLAGFDVAILRAPAIPTQGSTFKRRVIVALGVRARRAVGKVMSNLFMGGAEISLSPNLLAVLRPQAIGSL